MLFTEPVFAAFFVIVFCLYYLPLVQRFQVPLLLVASFCFYAYGQPYLLLLLVISAAISAGTSYAVLASTQPGAKKAWASAGVALKKSLLKSRWWRPIQRG